MRNNITGCLKSKAKKPYFVWRNMLDLQGNSLYGQKIQLMERNLRANCLFGYFRHGRSWSQLWVWEDNRNHISLLPQCIKNQSGNPFVCPYRVMSVCLIENKLVSAIRRCLFFFAPEIRPQVEAFNSIFAATLHYHIRQLCFVSDLDEIVADEFYGLLVAFSVFQKQRIWVGNQQHFCAVGFDPSVES